MFDAKKAKDGAVQWIRDWFEENGKGCNAVIGISGGKDSSIVAALCKEALGKDRVIGVLMPNGVQRDIEDSKALVAYLGSSFFQFSLILCKEGNHFFPSSPPSFFAVITSKARVKQRNMVIKA